MDTDGPTVVDDISSASLMSLDLVNGYLIFGGQYYGVNTAQYNLVSLNPSDSPGDAITSQWSIDPSSNELVFFNEDFDQRMGFAAFCNSNGDLYAVLGQSPDESTCKSTTLMVVPYVGPTAVTTTTTTTSPTVSGPTSTDTTCINVLTTDGQSNYIYVDPDQNLLFVMSDADYATGFNFNDNSQFVTDGQYVGVSMSDQQTRELNIYSDPSNGYTDTFWTNDDGSLVWQNMAFTATGGYASFCVKSDTGEIVAITGSSAPSTDACIPAVLYAYTCGGE